MAKILVIDDESQVRHVVRQILEAAGHEVAEAADGAEGLAQMAADMPGLLITDLLMPNKEGFETIREVRARAPALPIVVMSGNVSAELYLEMAQMLGAHAALAKPFRKDELLRTIDELLGRA